MRIMMTGVLTAAALAIAVPAFAQGVYVQSPDVTVGSGPQEYDHYRDDRGDYDRDRNREVNQEYNYDDGDCRIHVEREYHADGNYDEHRSRDCDDD